jgi:hypothetical protein
MKQLETTLEKQQTQELIILTGLSLFLGLTPSSLIA